MLQKLELRLKVVIISSFNQESLYLGVGAEDFLVKALVDNTDDKIKGPIIHPSKVIFGSTVGRVGTPVKITATAQICRAFDFVHMQE